MYTFFEIQVVKFYSSRPFESWISENIFIAQFGRNKEMDFPRECSNVVLALMYLYIHMFTLFSSCKLYHISFYKTIFQMFLNTFKLINIKKAKKT